MHDFFLTLPSNTEGDGNRTNSYRVQLPAHMDLQGDWEVGLSELFYPNSWCNITSEDHFFVLEGPGLDERSDFYFIPQKNYISVDDLVGQLNMAETKHGRKVHLEERDPTVNFFYKTNKNRVMVQLRGKGFRLHLSRKLQYILGYDTQMVITGEYEDSINYADHPPDITGGFNFLYVYCNLIAPQIVGNVNAQVLRVINMEKRDFGANIEKEYANPHYVPLLEKEFSKVEINIKDDRGSLVPFEFGKVVVKLHFRRRRY